MKSMITFIGLSYPKSFEKDYSELVEIRHFESEQDRTLTLCPIDILRI